MLDRARESGTVGVLSLQEDPLFIEDNYSMGHCVCQSDSAICINNQADGILYCGRRLHFA